MAGEKPVREMDTIMIRVPDGMKELVGQRARASGRSMSAEVLSILEKTLNVSGTSRNRQLKEMKRTLVQRLQVLEAEAATAKAQIDAIDAELEHQYRLNQAARDGNP